MKHPFGARIHLAFPMSRFRAYDNPVDALKVYLTDFIEYGLKRDVVVLGFDIPS